MMDKHSKGCILFDWGDTLMRDFTSFDGPMKDWPTVEAVPGAAETLAVLHPDWTLALATNAEASDEDDIWAALRRVGLDRWLDKAYCFKMIRHKKPSPEFFQYILDDLYLTPDRVVMVGDSYENDVLGANRSGLRAIWFNWQTTEVRENEMQRTIHELGAIPGILKDF
jgi:putative hydrolase of the HAD superfamily